MVLKFAILKWLCVEGGTSSSRHLLV